MNNNKQNKKKQHHEAVEATFESGQTGISQHFCFTTSYYTTHELGKATNKQQH